MAWLQRTMKLPPRSQGAYIITESILDELPEIAQVKVGILNIFILHTSASLTINENADPDVLKDLQMSLNFIVPKTFPYRHTSEGSDDMPAHVKSSLTQNSLQIPVSQGRLALGTWQGIYLLEHRYKGSERKLMLTLHYD